MVLVKNGSFFRLFILGNTGQGNEFYDILEQRNTFLGYEIKKLKKSKNWDFSKGKNLIFWSKMGYFSVFYFRQYRPGKWNLRYSMRKKQLSRLLKQEFKKNEKHWDFSKGVSPWFWSKMGHFSVFYFRQYRPGKWVLWYSRRKKQLSRL